MLIFIGGGVEWDFSLTLDVFGLYDMSEKYYWKTTALGKVKILEAP